MASPTLEQLEVELVGVIPTKECVQGLKQSREGIKSYHFGIFYHSKVQLDEIHEFVIQKGNQDEKPDLSWWWTKFPEECEFCWKDARAAILESPRLDCRRLLALVYQESAEARRRLRELQSHRATSVEGGHGGGQWTQKSKNVNVRMLDTILKNWNARGWTCTEWANYLKCGRSTVVETPTWKELAIARERLKLERQKDRRRKPKASDQRRD